MLSIRKIVIRAGCCGLVLAAWGCAADRPTDVPATAQIQADGGKRLVYTAPSNGRIWVTDVLSNSVIYAGPIRQGEDIAVDPDNNRVTMSGQVVATHDVGLQDHQIYFEPGTMDSGASPIASDNSASPTNVVPADAKLTAEGSLRVAYTAESRGTIWVVDTQTNHVIYSGRVAASDQIVIDPDGNNLTVNGQKVYDQQLVSNVNRRIFFKPVPDAVPGSM